jgi:hypothetical protein
MLSSGRPSRTAARRRCRRRSAPASRPEPCAPLQPSARSRHRPPAARCLRGPATGPSHGRCAVGGAGAARGRKSPHDNEGRFLAGAPRRALMVPDAAERSTSPRRVRCPAPPPSEPLHRHPPRSRLTTPWQDTIRLTSPHRRSNAALAARVVESTIARDWPLLIVDRALVLRRRSYRAGSRVGCDVRLALRPMTPSEARSTADGATNATR